jgi:DHA1 family multidrug resistance protein-like MFS transporter
VEGWRRSFFAILAAEVLALTGFMASIPVIPFYLRELGVTDPTSLKLWVGACSTVVAVTLAVFAPLWGQLADTLGKRPMLLRAMFGGAAVMALMGLAGKPWQLLVLRGFQGALTGTVAAATVLVATISPVEQVGFTLGLLQTGIYVGSSMGPAVGGVLADFLGYRANFFASAVLLLSAAFIVLRFVPDDRRGRVRGTVALRRLLPDFAALAASPGLVTLLLVSGALQVAASTVSPILPLFIQSISPNASRVGSLTGLILGLSALSAALSAAGLGRVSHRLGYQRTLAACLAGAVLIFLPQAFVTRPWQLLALRMAGGAFIGGAEPSVNALIATRTEKGRQGIVFGVNASVNSAGAAVGPMVGALLSAAFGYASAFFAGAAVLLAAVTAFVRVARARRALP